MTDVLIIKHIPGASPGDVRPLDERMERHVRAGNATLLPDAPAETEAVVEHREPEAVLQGASTGSWDGEEDAELEGAADEEE